MGGLETMNQLSWFAVQTRSRHEKRVRAQLADETSSISCQRQSGSINGRIGERRWRFRSLRGTALQDYRGRIGLPYFNPKVWFALLDLLDDLSQSLMKKLSR